LSSFAGPRFPPRRRAAGFPAGGFYEYAEAPVLDEDPPDSWEVEAIESAGATFKPTTVEWIWIGAWSAGDSKTVIYEVTVPSDAEPNTYLFAGRISAYGVGPFPVKGQKEVVVGGIPPTSFRIYLPLILKN